MMPEDDSSQLSSELANGDWRSVIGRVYQIARLFNATAQAH